MSRISKKITREKLAALVVKKLLEHGIEAVLVGGSVVSMYTANEYESLDLDFISPADHRRIAQAMFELGFVQKGKDFVHPNIEFTIEFPSGPLGIGDDVPVKPEGKKVIDGVTIKMFSPTQAVMDRLLIFFLENDRQCLDQSLAIAKRHRIDVTKLTNWARKERQEEKLTLFLKKMRQAKT